jgi:hypothetical protein
MTDPDPNATRDALRDAIALVRAQSDEEQSALIPWVIYRDDLGQAWCNPVYVRLLAGLITVSRELAAMLPPATFDAYCATKIRETLAADAG